jgi:hypothetical protein
VLKVSRCHQRRNRYTQVVFRALEFIATHGKNKASLKKVPTLNSCHAYNGLDIRECDAASEHAPISVEHDWRGSIQVGVRDTSLSSNTRHKDLYVSEQENVLVHLQLLDPHEQISAV